MTTNPSYVESISPSNPFIIFLKEPLDTLNYFSDNMAENTPNSHILYANEKNQNFFEELISLDSYINEETYVITFNNIGLQLTCNNQYYWDMKHVRLYNIQVDAPIWYLDILNLDLKSMTIISVDKKHMQFLHKYFPAHPTKFLLHGGVLSSLCATSYEDRATDILYIGNRNQLVQLKADDYISQFLQTTGKLLLKYPFMTPEQLPKLFFRETAVPMNPDYYLECVHTLYCSVGNIRAYYPENILAALAKAHFHVTVYGEN